LFVCDGLERAMEKDYEGEFQKPCVAVDGLPQAVLVFLKVWEAVSGGWSRRCDREGMAERQA